MMIILGLASWRIANMLVEEAGPNDIFEKIRTYVGVKPGIIEGFLPSLFSCIYCMSVWTTIFVYLLWVIEPVSVMIIAAMTIALIVNRIFEPR